MQKQGQGLETLGSILAVAGWGLASLALVLFLVTLGEVLDAGMDDVVFPILFSLAITVVVCMALAGLGHLLRAVAQLGRNVHRLARLVAADARPASSAEPDSE